MVNSHHVTEIVINSEEHHRLSSEFLIQFRHCAYKIVRSGRKTVFIYIVLTETGKTVTPSVESSDTIDNYIERWFKIKNQTRCVWFFPVTSWTMAEPSATNVEHFTLMSINVCLN